MADSSLDYDLRRKPLIYASYGVRELWVIDAAHRVIHVHREGGPGGFASIAVREAADRIEPAFAPRELAVALADLPEV